MNEIHSQTAPRTRQREALERALHELGETAFDAPELLRVARRHRAGIGLATVYRTLAAWRASGGVREIPDLPGRYVACERPSRHHHHVVCVSCRRARETTICPERAAARSLRRSFGFSLRRHTAEYVGLCAQCRAR